MTRGKKRAQGKQQDPQPAETTEPAKSKRPQPNDRRERFREQN